MAIYSMVRFSLEAGRNINEDNISMVLLYWRPSMILWNPFYRIHTKSGSFLHIKQ